MSIGQLELPLFDNEDSDETKHSALLRWDPVGKPDGTYTLTCNCGAAPLIAHSWVEQEATFLDHCKRGNP